jgi:hypothetical protein
LSEQAPEFAKDCNAPRAPGSRSSAGMCAARISID